MRVLPILLLALALGGCATTPEEHQARIRALSYAAASLGTQEALLQKPEWRGQFEAAYTNLNSLVESRVVTGVLLRQVIASLPVKELKSPQARIAIETATVLFDATAGTKLDVEKAPYLLAAATGIRDGLKAGLAAPPALRQAP